MVVAAGVGGPRYHRRDLASFVATADDLAELKAESMLDVVWLIPALPLAGSY
jgi:hypothetical protein